MTRPLVAVCLFATPGLACRLEAKAEVLVRFEGNRPLVELRLDGRPATFLLDTGSDRTIIAARTVQALGIARDPWVGTALRGVGGVVERTANATLRSFTLGGLELRRRSVAPVLSFAVAPLELGEPGIAGLLGADYLSAYDLDLDLPGGRLRLVRTVDCTGATLPWGVPNTSVPLERATATVVLAPVTIGGRRLRAQIDTGATISLVSLRGAAALGTTGDGEAGTARGIGRQAMALRRRGVASLAVGSVEFGAADLWFGAPPTGFAFDMLLGADVLGRRRVFLSYATNRLLVAN